ncbi:MAG: response regulator [Thiomargarita sp.]|nr:response regulator [Thiomargarita sp.]
MTLDDFHNKTLLIIDDEPANLGGIEDYLQGLHFKIFLASNGETGINLAISKQPDLILLDVMMPGIDGFETCKRLKANEHTKKIPVLFITALNDVQDKIKGFEVGSVDYITKPFYGKEVLIRIKTHLTLREMQKKLERQNIQLQKEIFERQKTENILKKYLDDLDHARQEILDAKKQAYIAKDIAEQANQDKSDFLANISLEIATPLKVIHNTTQLFFNTTLTESQSYYLSKIESVSDSLGIIIDDISDLSKIEAGKLHIAMILFNLEVVIEKLINSLSVKIKEKKLQLLLSINKNVPLALIGDPLRLEEILTKLIMNAIKFTEQGCIIIAIEVVALETTRVKLLFSIKDTGIGIQADVLPQLFQAFKQDATPPQITSSGRLGLAVCQSLAHMMEGNISVESELDKGSTFNFTAVFNIQEEKNIFQLPSELHGLKVLIIDNEETALEQVQNILRSLSFETSCATSCDLVLENLKATEQSMAYHLILVDETIQDFEKIEAVLQNMSLPKSFIILMMSEHSDSNHKHLQKTTSQNIWVDAFISKPVSPYALIHTIMWLFAQTRDMSYPLPQIGKRILVVEDNLISQQVIETILKSKGLSVDIANNGQEAVSMLALNDFDLIIMDIQMPEMNGMDATRLIRKNFQYDCVPIIGISAHGMSNEKDECLAIGMNDYMYKPITKINMFSILEKWLPDAEQSTIQE